MSFTINGNVIKGIGFAKVSIPAQMPAIFQQFPEIQNVFQGGTINIRLDHNLIIMHPDFITSPIVWNNGIGNFTETFGFLRCKIIVNQTSHQAWIYIPFDSAHRKRFDIHEFLAPRIQILPGMPIKVEFDNQFFRLPYSQNQAYVV